MTHTAGVRRPGLVIGMVIVAVALSACGSAETASTTTAGDAAAGTDLVVTVSEDGRTSSERWTLQCDPDAGSHPQADTACSFLDTAPPDVFDPVSDDLACTEIYGGDQTAQVVGRWAGDPVDATFSRINGCEIDRWDTALPLLVLPGGA